VTNTTFEWNRRHGGAGDSINNGLWEGCKLNYNGRDINSGVTVGDQGALSLGLRYGNGWDMEGYGLGSKVTNITFRDCEARQNVRDGLLFYATVDAAAGAFEPRTNILVTGCRLDIGTEPISGDYAMTFTSTIATEANGSVFKDVIVSDCVLEGAINLRAVTNPRIHGNIFTIPSLLVMSNLDYVVDAAFADNQSNQTNVYGTADSTWVNHDYTFRGSATWNPGAIAPGATATVAVPCTGAQYGMYVSAGMSTLGSALNAALILSAFVVFPLNSVQVSIHNPTALTKTVTSGTIKVKASRD
jgi:hypothetical protein